MRDSNTQNYDISAAARPKSGTKLRTCQPSKEGRDHSAKRESGYQKNLSDEVSGAFQKCCF